MKPLNNSRQYFLGITLILTITGCTHQQTHSSQSKMMISDEAPRTDAMPSTYMRRAQPMPSEPLLFEPAPGSPPAATLSDNDAPTQRINSKTLEITTKPRPLPQELMRR